ncbi:calcium-binding protein [Nitrospirillum viridazoti]|uniref:Cadherin domain-containing protein n=1 Tax=Nitrospirillum viridazoti CBAmc TaxID=1441467 RepID=A0A248K1V9_9PROT|nr:calcium-binding protein [Nitrospirillum amazonense]ASG24922.1 hypothetical protein Y958_28455 [Nitrospirillum amazonense CBAmc]TWB30012.1 Ca2+-binding RTX toxin-like protein [Nitrospirillum amazonense]
MPGPYDSIPETIANSYTASDQTTPSVAVLADGSYVVSWASAGQDGDGSGIYAQHFAGDGQKTGDEFRVNTVTAGNEVTPFTVALPNGGYEVVWNQGGTIVAQRYNADDTPSGGQTTLGTGNGPKAAVMTNGNLVVVWNYNGVAYGRIYNGSGAAVGGQMQVSNSVAAQDGQRIAITALPNGGFATSWDENLNNARDVFWWQFDASGNSAGGPYFLLGGPAGGNQTQASIAALTGGDRVVVFADDTAPWDGSGTYDILLRRYNASGTLVGGTVRIDTFTAGTQLQPQVTALPDGGYLVTWVSNGQDGSGYGVYGQRYDSRGVVVGGQFRLNDATSGDQLQPSIAVRADGTVVAAWTSQTADGNDIVTKVLPVSPLTAGSRDTILGLQGAIAAKALVDIGQQYAAAYQFQDMNADPASGYFTLNGVVQAAGSVITVTAAQLSGLRFVAGTGQGDHTIAVRISDGTNLSDWAYSTVTVTAASGNYTPGPASVVNSYTDGDQTAPSVTFLANGSYVVTWTSAGQDGDGAGIYGQRFAADGQKLGDEFRVNTVTAGAQSKPVVVGLADGGFQIIWQQSGGALGGQRYDANGNAMGNQITMGGMLNSVDVAATLLTNGNVVVTWSSGGLTYGQLFNDNGMALTGAFRLDGFLASSDVERTSVTPLANGTFIVAYDFVNGAAGRDIFLQKFDANGTGLGDYIYLMGGPGPGNQLQASLAGLTDGGYVVAFIDDTAPWDGTGTYDILLRRYNASGTLVGGTVRVDSVTTDTQLQPKVVAMPDGGYLVTWASNNEDGSGYGVYAQRYDANGTRIGGEFRLNDTTDGNQYQANLDVRADGSVVVVWASQTATGYDIMTKTLAATPPAAGGRTLLLGMQQSVAARALIDMGAQYASVYQFQDMSADPAGGYFTLNGVVQAAGSVITVTAAQLRGLRFVAGTGQGDNTVAVRIGDGKDYSGWAYSTVTVTAASGNYTPGPESVVNSYTDGDQTTPSVTFLTDGSYVVTWTSAGQDGDGAGIYGQRFAADGQKLGDEFRVNLLTAGAQGKPVVVGLADGGFQIIWQQTGGALAGRRYDSNGNAVGDPITMGGMLNSVDVAATLLTNGNVVVTWSSGGLTYGQLFNDNGMALTGAFRVDGFLASSDVERTSVTPLANGTFIVAYDVVNGAAGRDIFLQKFDASGTGSGNSIYLLGGPGSGSQLQASLAGLTDGGYVVAFIDDTAPWDGTGTYDILLRRYNASGTLVGGTVRVDSVTTDTQLQPKVVAMPDGGYLVTWASNNEDGSGYGVYAQRYDANGTRIGGEFRLNDTTDGNQYQANLDVRADGSVVVVWASQTATGYDIMTKTLAAAPPAADARTLLVRAQGTLAPKALVYNWNQAVVAYQFQEIKPGGGYFTVDGDAEATGDIITLTPDQLTRLRFVGSNTAATDVVMVRVSDGVTWSEWQPTIINTVVPAPASATGTEVIANTYMDGDQTWPTVTVLKDGTYVVTWTSPGQDGDGDAGGIYAQLFTATGQKIGDEFRVTLLTGGTQSKPAVVGLADGGFQVIWQQAGGPLAGRRYDSNGNAVGDPITMGGMLNSIDVSATLLTNDNVVVTWSSGGLTYGQLFNDNGMALTGAFRVDGVLASADVEHTSVTPLANGTFIVAYDFVNGAAGRDVFLQKFDASGTGSGNSIYLLGGPGSGSQLQASLAGLTDGGYVVAFVDSTASWDSAAGTYDILLRRYNAAGTLMGSTVRVNTYTAGNQTQPKAVALPDGGYLVTWASNNEDGSGYGVYAQRFDASGAKAGGEFRLNDTTDGNQYQASVVVQADGGLMAVWASQTATGYDIVTKLLPSAGPALPYYAPLRGTDGPDLLTGSDERNTISGYGGNDTLTGGASDDVISGGAGDDILAGMGGDDTLSGGTGNDTLDGGTGVDYMVGGIGDDLYLVDNAGDVVLENPGEGTDEVRTTAASYTLSANVEKLTFVGTGNFTGTGNAQANVITGGAGNDLLAGGAGDDTLAGGAGIDTLVGGAGNDLFLVDNVADVVTENAGEGNDEVRATAASYALSANIETLTFVGTGDFTGTGNAQNNLITGGAGNDVLSGAGGDDTLVGNGGADTMLGGTGNDTYVVDSVTDVVAENAGEGTDGIRTTLATYTLGANFENLTYTGTNAFSGFGNSLNNTIIGGIGDDVLDGAAGADALIGGAGNDLYVVDNAGDVVTENPGEGLDEVRTTLAAYTLTPNVENLTFTGSGNFTGTGNALGNLITGGTGNDQLIGGTGADTLIGGMGDDTYGVDDTGDVLQENAGEGTDTILTTLTGYTLGANFENLTYTGTAAFAGTGNGLGNLIKGGAGGDQLDGAAGADTLIGGAGNDTYWVDDAGDVVTENAAAGTDEVRTTLNAYTLGANVENLTYIGTEAFTGIGNELANVITGGAGDDMLIGGAGNDIFRVNSANDVVVENAGEGTDEVQATSASYTLGANIEKLTYTGSGTFYGVGNNLANTLTGGAGSDTLDGGAGADTLIGGAGDDVYIVDNAGDVVTEGSNAGTDEVRTSLNAYALDANMENLTFTGTGNFVGTGNNTRLNVITGGAGDDTLDGGTGADTLIGGVGNDVYIADNGADVVIENPDEGVDLVKVSAAGYTLGANIENMTYTGTAGFLGNGNELDNVIIGGAGNDTIDGKAGNDILIGGAGNEIYYVDSVNDVIVENANEGTDLVRATSASYTLSANIENLTFWGTGNFRGVGNDLANTLTGGAGDDVLDGGLGADTLNGGAGNDTYYIDNVGDVIGEGANGGTDEVRTTLNTYSMLVNLNLENLAFLGTGNFAGTGNNVGNSLTGGAGDDTLDGGAGADTLVGGAGNDTYIVDNAGDLVVEAAGAGVDLVKTSVATYALTADVDNLTYTGTLAFTGTGNALGNVITSGAGNDTLNGGAGADTLVGGAGNDVYFVDSLNDVVVENAGEGADEVRSSVAGYVLSANIEKLTYVGADAFTGMGNDAANVLTGGAGNDVLNGAGGNDTLNGGAGDDTLIGGTGDDIFQVDSANDVVVENPGEGADEVQATSASYTLSANVEKLTYTGSGNFSGVGNALTNTVTGGGGNDTLDGGAGVDTLIGGLGNDIYLVDDANDVVTETGAGADEVWATAPSYILSANVENLRYVGTGNFYGTGNTLSNLLVGGGGNDTLDGGAAADTMIGGAGNDVYVVSTALDVVIENAGEGTDEIQTGLANYTLTSANVENVTYTGGAGTAGFTVIGNELNNVLRGNAAVANSITGGAGDDTMIGGSGNDTYFADSANDVVVEAAGGGTDEVKVTASSYTLGANVENLTYTGSGNFYGVGNDLANSLIGATGNDTLDGGAGADTMGAGTGDDVYYVDDLGDVVKENSGGGADEIRTWLTNYTLVSANVENLTFIGTGNFSGTGSILNNQLTGGMGDDTLDGAAGVDTLIGGAGNDTYVVDNAGDVVRENAGAGTDTVRTTLATYTLGANVENLTYTGTVAFTGTGNELNNVITGGAANDSLTGGAGDDTLDGGSGNDTLVGGTGNDVYLVDSATDVVTEAVGAGTDEVRTTLASYTLGANVENLTYTGSGSFTGRGNALANVITGGAGNDVLDGGTGADTLVGGAGNDTYLVDDAGDVVTEAAGAGVDTVQTTLVSYTLGSNVENLTYTGTGAFTGTGNALANVITGGAGNDVLDGGTGADTLVGGAGNDTYLVDDAGDVVMEAAGAGVDTVQTTLVSYTLGSNVENLTYTGTGAFTGTGNALANIITGGAGDDVLDGGTGADTLVGGGGNDTYLVDDADDVVMEAAGAGVDTVQTTLVSYTLSGNVENLTYTGAGSFTGTGNALANVITGGAGDDVLDGAAGADTLVGGTGNDTYLVDDAGDVVTEAAGAGVDTVQTTLMSYTLGGNVENLTYTGSAAFTGTGNALANVITGGAGDDLLDGGTGADTLVGGGGNDTYLVDDADDVVMEAAGAGVDTVQTTLVSYTLSGNVENLTYTGSAAFTGTGNALANVITGGAGDDLLDGGTGADTLIGGGGNDTYLVDDAGDVVTEVVGAGTDEVRTTLASYTLGDNVENLTYTGMGAFTGTGNDLDNVITGGSGDDTFAGGLGNDTYVFGLNSGSDVITDGAGANALVFSSDVDPGSLVFQQSGNDLVLSLTTGNTVVTYANYYSDPTVIGSVQVGSTVLVPPFSHS